jgi:PAS domain S-box-containing protein
VIKIYNGGKKGNGTRRPSDESGKGNAIKPHPGKSASARLERSEQRYRALIDAMSEGFCVLEIMFDEAGHALDYRFVETNPAFAKHTGLVDAVGRTAREIAPGLEPTWFERYGQVALTGEPMHFVDRAEGLGRWFDVEAFRIGEPENRHVALLFTDITEQRDVDRRLRESEAELRFTLEAADFGAWALELEGPPPHRAIRSRKHDQIFGYDELLPEWNNAIFLEHVLEEDRPHVEESFRQALAENHDWEFECRIRRADGEVRWIWAKGHLVRGTAGHPRRMLGLVTDITSRKQAEAALLESDRHKDEFIAMLAHELRNPLAAIRTAIGVLAGASDTSPLVDEMAAIIARQSFQLARLIDDLLDVSRMSRGTMSLKKAEIDVRTILQQSVADQAAACQNKGLSLTAVVPEDPVLVEADPVRMAQVVNNLVQNACQFTPRGGSIRAAVEREDDDFVLRVSDSGVGMSGDQLERVFEMFVQLDEPDIHRVEGLGIGLSIAKHIVELHGGQIVAKSTGPGQGSEFVVSVPLSASRNSKAGHRYKAEARHEPREGTARRILVADDSRDALRALALMLRARGYEVTTAIDGADAFEKADEHRPDIAFLDIGMPRMDGYEAARQIRREPWGEGILLVALTGWGQEHDRRQALEAGFDVHLTKPADLAMLEDVIAGRRKPDAKVSVHRRCD